MQKLKLSKETVSVLKNFNQINSNIYFRKGNVISTISSAQTILAKYAAPETFKSDFGIYKLDKLLSVLTFFSEPELQIGDKNLTVKSDKQSAKIAFADISVLEYPKKDVSSLPTVDAEFRILEEDINDIIKASSIMELPFIAFEGDGKTVFMKASDYKNPSGDSFTVEIEQNNAKQFTAIFNVSNLKLIPADYDVEVSARGIAKFSNDKMTYYIAVEKDSTFE